MQPRRQVLLDRVLLDRDPRPASVITCLLLIAASLLPLALGSVPAVDRVVRSWTRAHQTPEVFAVLDALTRSVPWRGVCTLVLAVAAVTAVAQRALPPLRQAALSVIFFVVVTAILKAVVGRPGPTGVAPHPYDGAWPSGHAVALVVATVVLLRLLSAAQPRSVAWMVAAWLPAVIVGVSLIYCGHHWFTDVAVAFPLGLLIGWAAQSVERLISHRPPSSYDCR